MYDGGRGAAGLLECEFLERTQTIVKIYDIILWTHIIN